MAFTTAADQVSRGQDVTVLASGAVTATGTSAGIDVGGAGTLRAQVQVTAATGTSPSLTVTIQTSHDAGATDAWRTAGAAYGALTAAGNSPYQCFVVDRYVRVSYAVSGTTPNITFSVVGEAV
jgi:uncharacterized protein YfaA (DUF2138 family)